MVVLGGWVFLMSEVPLYMAAMLDWIRHKSCFLSSGRDDLQTFDPAP